MLNLVGQFKLQCMQNTHFEDEFVKFTFSEGILLAEYKTDKIDLTIAEHIIKRRLEYFNTSDYPLLADYRKVIETKKEARDLFATAEGTKYFKALAVLTNSPAGNMMYNFYMLLSKPGVPTKLFFKKEEAITWLKEFI